MAQDAKVLEALAAFKAKVALLPKDKEYANSKYNEYAALIKEANDAYDAVLSQALAKHPVGPAENRQKFTKDNVWLWGGPTPSWGGCMDDDTLVRAMDYLGIEQGVYVYGPVNEKMIALHDKYRRMMCQVTSICRAPGAQAETDEEASATVSRLSLTHPNIVAGLCDDFAPNLYGRLTPEHVHSFKRALTSVNPNLKLTGVFYTENLDKDFTPVLDDLDIINLWVWKKHQLMTLDEDVDKCLSILPGKPILMGIFMHDYGDSDTCQPDYALLYHLRKANQYLNEGKIQGIIILGDREVWKWPNAGKLVKDYLQSQWG